MISLERGAACDFLLVTGDAWVDHPSFGAAVVARTLSAEGFSVAVLSQPRWADTRDFDACPRPRLAVMVTGGNLDSMVAHYTVAKRRRERDFYTPGGVTGRRPDRAAAVYSALARRVFPGLPLILGGLEASLRRFAHYDYWSDGVRPSLSAETGADLLVYGMGERAVRETARRLDRGEGLEGIAGTCLYRETRDALPRDAVRCPSLEACAADKRKYLEAALLQYAEHDPVRGRTLVQPHGAGAVVCYPPAKPLTTAERDAAAAYPYTRLPDPAYTEPVPALEEVRFSVIHNRGCFGSCRFCSLAFHQGRFVSARSHASVLREIEALTREPDFKGYIHDIGGPTANFRHNACAGQARRGACRDRSCLTPEPCPKLETSHADFLALLRKARAVPGVKKAFIRSGVRYDYLLLDKSRACLRELAEHHTSGQLKVAPEHCVDGVLRCMGKPGWAVFERFAKAFGEAGAAAGKKQFLVPYLISSHPGATLEDAVEMALTLKRLGRHPEQVQDFYPTPGTLSTCMYYTGLDVRTRKPLYVAKAPGDKAMQRALLQWKNPKNKPLVIAALKKAGRENLIGVFYPRRKEKGKRGRG
ncbi:MAG: YgiQ family radical SAM protein [Oscillospiraceae bacterium]|nr:YgiQ family radical SAM protein [Oscillospiraceae bacterium]